jgi:hypothetical protein
MAAEINVSVSSGAVTSNTSGIAGSTAVANMISISQVDYDNLGTSVSSTTLYIIT